MKIRFKKKILHRNLIIGIVWTGLGVFSVLVNDILRWSDYGYLLVGFLYIGHYLYDVTNQYLTIENGTIRKNILYGFGKKISLDEINAIKKFAGEYTLKTERNKLKINTDVIDNVSLTALNKILEELNVPADKTTFAQY